MTTIRLFVVDQSEAFIQYLHDELDTQSNIEIVGYTTRAENILLLCAETAPHILILGQINTDSLLLIQAIRKQYPHICIISITDNIDIHHARQHLSAGVGGYLLRRDTSPNLATTILTAHQGQAIISSEVTRALL